MSTTPATFEETIEQCRPEDATPVSLGADDLESTAPEYLRDLKYELSRSDLVVARIEVGACFDADCSLATQDEVDTVREYVRAAAFLGAGTLTVDVDEVANPEKVEPALDACEERARREGVALEIRR